MGYPTHGEELDILHSHRSRQNAVKLQAVASAADVLDMQKALDDILCAPPVLDYIVSIVETTRALNDVLLGVSPRGSIALMQAAKGAALLEGRRYVLPDDVQRMAFPVLCHRLVMRTRAGMTRQTPESVIDAVLRTVPVPSAK